MAVFHSHSVRCNCGQTMVVQLADSLNVRRFPEARNRILKGELHRATCATCQRTMTVEKPFYYTDLDRNAIFKVLPRGERHTWKRASRDLDKASRIVPASVASSDGRTLRVVFGMDELREKLLAQDARIDDRVLELLKVLLVYEHPFLLRRPRLCLALDAVGEIDLEFLAAYEHDPRRFRISLPRAIADDIGSREDELRSWVGKTHREDLFALPDHWVNMWRWSPQPTALDRLRAYAEELEAGGDIETSSAAFRQMLTGLPRGTHLPGWAKRDLRSLFEYAKANDLGALQDELFEIRFDHELEDDWSRNDDPEDIDTLWKLLKDLPDTNVEGNTKIREILLDAGGGGTYSPTTFDIAIGSDLLSHQESFEDVVRHEVGHAVHEMKGSLVDGWLTTRFGWRVFDTSDGDIDQWVGLMGGWGGLTATQRRDVRTALRRALGNGSSWNPGPTPVLPPGHPWHAPGFGPRLAFERTGANWYRNFRTWHRANGKAFFLNYWYRALFVVDQATLDLVGRMPDDYAAMSHYEFFAELYALYYDQDDEVWSEIPPEVRQWLEDNIGAPEPDAPMPAAPAPKKTYETVTRPSKSPKKSKK